MKRLPRALDDLNGLRAARWFRESTRGQWDNYGPEAQRDQQDRAIERFGLTDTGIEWSVAHSGRTVTATADFGDMMARAGVDYDVLVVGYVSRFARNLKQALIARDDIHAAGAAVLFCDERLLSSDEDRWDEFVREAHEAESYSRRLGKRIREGYEAKFRRFADPGGFAPLGFRRSAERPYVMSVDPATMPRVVSMFERYATGFVSIERLAREFGMPDRTLNDTLKNPIYNGWVVRKGDRSPAAWRAAPPVPDHLWERVQSVLARKARHGGSNGPKRVDLLRGLLVCVCGQRIRTDGLMGTPPRQRKVHPRHDECPHWGRQASYSAPVWERPILAQIETLRVDDRTIADVGRALATPDVPPRSLDEARQERRRRDLALDFAAGRMTQAEFTEAIAALSAVEEPAPRADMGPEIAVARLRDFRSTWDALDELGEAGKALKAELLAAVYDEITVRGAEIVRVSLTESAEASGFALALSERVKWVQARPTGVDRARTHSIRIPIVGATEWRRAARRLA